MAPGKLGIFAQYYNCALRKILDELKKSLALTTEKGVAFAPVQGTEIPLRVLLTGNL
jgi:hypothetical protein